MTQFNAKSTTDDVLSGVDLSGKRFLVTGVSAGLGVETARARRLDTLTIEQVSGAFVYGTPVGRALQTAGFVEASRGLTLRRAR